MRRILLAATLAVALAAGATTATAQGFSGPWDSAHEPQTITSAGVTRGVEDNSWFSIVVSSTVLAPSTDHVVPLTVTFSDPSGSESVSITPLADEPCRSRVTLEDMEREGKCELAKWTQPAHNQQVDFTISQTSTRLPSGGEVTVGEGFSGERFWFGATEVQFEPTKATPFFYQVTGSSGIIAQAAMTATQTPVETGDSHNLSPCIDSGHGLRSENGELVCEQTFGGQYSFSQSGWPAPPAPAEPQIERPIPPLTLIEALGAVKHLIKSRTHRSAYHLTDKCRLTGTQTATCKATWDTAQRVTSTTTAYAGTFKVDARYEPTTLSFVGGRARVGCVRRFSTKRCASTVRWHS
jgi:hypothetical protein